MPDPRRVRLPGIPSRLFTQIGVSLASVWNPSDALPVRGRTSKMPERSRCAFHPAILSSQLPYRSRHHCSDERCPQVAHPGLRPLVQRLLSAVHPGATIPTRSSHSRPGCGLVTLSRSICCQLKNTSVSSLYFICFFLLLALLVFCISLAYQGFNDYLLASSLRVLSLCWSWVQRLLCPGAFGGSVRDPRTRLLVMMARAEEQPGPAHWPCWLSHSPLLLMLAPTCTERSVQMGLHSCLSAYCCCCRLPAPSCVKALHRGTTAAYLSF